jgi:dTMP kinase
VSWGETIRSVLLHQNLSRDATAEFLLFTAARAQLVYAVICPWLEQGGMVFADRNTDSSEVYQGWGGGDDLELIRMVNDSIAQEARPSGTLWLDALAHLGERQKIIWSRGARIL